VKFCHVNTVNSVSGNRWQYESYCSTKVCSWLIISEPNTCRGEEVAVKLLREDVSKGSSQAADRSKPHILHDCEPYSCISIATIGDPTSRQMAGGCQLV
jgi:hypothetical protein